MLRISTTSRHYDAAIELTSSGHFSVYDGKSSYNIKWDPRVLAISYVPIPGSKERKLIIRVKGVSIIDAKTGQQVFGLYDGGGDFSSHDDEGHLIASLPIFEFECVSDNYIASRPDKKHGSDVLPQPSKE